MSNGAVVYDRYSYEIDADPYPVYKRMRDQALPGNMMIFMDPPRQTQYQ
jgi:hypothetical protein